MSSFSNPTSLTSFQCYGLNVTGPGIQMDTRLGCTDPSSGMGRIAGFVPVSSGTIDMLVPAGAARKIELIGVQSDVGCPILDALLASGGVNALNGIGDPFILGSTTTDIFDDTAVTIFASFDFNKKAFQSCGNNHNSNPRMAFDELNHSATAPIQTNACMPLRLSVNESNSVAPDLISFNISSGNTQIFDNLSCEGSAVTEVPYAQGEGMKELSIMTSETTTFTVQAVPLDSVSNPLTGWETPITTFNSVADRFEAVLMGASTTKINECNSIDLSRLDSGNIQNNFGGSSDLAPYSVSFYSAMNGMSTTTPGIKVFYSYNDCASDINSVNASISQSGLKGFNLAFQDNIPIQNIYFKNSNTENLNVSFKTNDNSIQEAHLDLMFSAWTYLSMSSIEGPSSGGRLISLTASTSGNPSITGIKIGSSLCTNFQKTTSSHQNVFCDAPAGSGDQPIHAITPSGIYFTGFYYHYLPSVTPGQVLNVALNTTMNPTQVTSSGGVLYGCDIPDISFLGLTVTYNCEIVENPETPKVESFGQKVYPVLINGIEVGSIVLSVVDPTIPTLLTSTDFYGDGCSPFIGCNLIGPANYEFTLGQKVALFPTGKIAGPIPTNCTISPALPSGSGLTFRSNCSITGTPNMNDYNGISGTTLYKAYTITSGASNATVNLSVVAPPIMNSVLNVYVTDGSTINLSQYMSGGNGSYEYTLMSGDGTLSGANYTAPAAPASGTAEIYVSDLQVSPHVPGASVSIFIHYGIAPRIAKNQVINLIQGAAASGVLAIENDLNELTICNPTSSAAGLSGVSFVPGCTLSGMPTAVTGNYSISIHASNHFGQSTETVTFRVAASQTNGAVISPGQTLTLGKGIDLNRQLQFASGSGVSQSIIFKPSCVGFPPFLFLTNSGQLVGKIPSNNGGGTANCTIETYNPNNIGAANYEAVTINW